jgi:hypothetical protein
MMEADQSMMEDDLESWKTAWKSWKMTRNAEIVPNWKIPQSFQIIQTALEMMGADQVMMEDDLEVMEDYPEIMKDDQKC